MKFEVQLAGQAGKSTRIVELERDAEGWRVTLDGRPVAADAVEVAPNTLSILLAGQSYEICVAPSVDGKLRLQTGGLQITAPMPGKVVRLLVKTGDRVEAGQGLLVVEAMKMQNEIRSPKSGTVERVFVQEGQPVSAGEVLAAVS